MYLFSVNVCLYHPKYEMFLHKLSKDDFVFRKELKCTTESSVVSFFAQLKVQNDDFIRGLWF